MSEERTRVVVDLAALPPVFRGVLEAKSYLATGAAKTAAEAARMAGISRAAFYKYREAISPLGSDEGQAVTVHLTLRDQPGVLSGVLAAFAAVGANILTVNQNIPAHNAATVSIAARLGKATPQQLLTVLQNVPGVRKIDSMR